MQKGSYYIVNFDEKSQSPLKISVHRFWRRLPRQQRTTIIGSLFLLLLVFIYVVYYKHSTKSIEDIPYEQHLSVINNKKETWRKKQPQENQLSTARTFSTPTNDRQIAVRDGMRHAWKAYRTYAWGYDELEPISKTPSVWFGLGCTIVDAIDTLYIMNMTEEYNQAREWIKTSFNVDSTSVDKYNSHFEITIRLLGGLLSIYHLTMDEIFLKRATELGDRLLLNFNSSTGLPYTEINLKENITNPSPPTSELSTAEVGTVQLEMRDLSRITGDKKYENAADKSAATLHNQAKNDGLVSIGINSATGKFSGPIITFGARGDSYYEYLLKQWLQTGQKRPSFWDDWFESMRELMDMTTFSPKMDHLACFLAGNMALGWNFHRSLTHLFDMAKNLTETCYQMYAQQPTGLSPEIAYFNIEPNSSKSSIIIHEGDTHNLLRPEVVESLYYMYHLTGDKIYQDWGWKIFQAFEKYSRIDNGYTTIDDVRNKTNVQPRNKMESFFLAETLKYLYLLFDTTNLFPFNQWIFNTEAHPLPIYSN
ncbi:unnamed protein product [Adineta steineri]|uniref:alpha-1,2-Mannosidase n=2 Tax=Adineta steineri TaxID=433720 RepID=A0A814YH90_9BILA|nr:unnamed protein product [Adineta steineri]